MTRTICFWVSLLVLVIRFVWESVRLIFWLLPHRTLRDELGDLHATSNPPETNMLETLSVEEIDRILGQ